MGSYLEIVARTTQGEHADRENMHKGSGWNESSQAWVEHLERGDGLREYVLDPALLARLGDIRGMSSLDVGCGEGRWCRKLARLGAKTSGIDPTVSLLSRAKALDPEGEYQLGFAEELPHPDATFDIVLSYLMLLDVPDYQTAIQEMARVLKPGGRLFVLNLQSFVTCSEHLWAKDETGKRLFFKVDWYGAESGLRAKWAGIDIANYHRPLSHYIAVLLGAGLELVSFAEPLPDPVAISNDPALARMLRLPYAYIMEWRKK